MSATSHSRSGPLPTPPARVRVDRRAFMRAGPADMAVCFALEGAPGDATEALPLADGVLLRSVVRAQVVGADAGGLRLRTGDAIVRLKALLPEGLDLGGLLGADVTVQLEHACRQRRRTTVDVVMRDAGGDLLLWARDGGLPSPGAGAGSRARLSLGAGDGPGLAVVTPDGAVLTAQPRRLATSQGPRAWALLALRAGPDDAAFALVRC